MNKRIIVVGLVAFAGCRERTQPTHVAPRTAKIEAPIAAAAKHPDAPPPLPTTAPAPRPHLERAEPARAQRERGIELLDEAIARTERAMVSADANRMRALEIRKRRLEATRALRRNAL